MARLGEGGGQARCLEGQGRIRPAWSNAEPPRRRPKLRPNGDFDCVARRAISTSRFAALFGPEHGVQRGTTAPQEP